MQGETVLSSLFNLHWIVNDAQQVIIAHQVLNLTPEGKGFDQA